MRETDIQTHKATWMEAGEVCLGGVTCPALSTNNDRLVSLLGLGAHHHGAVCPLGDYEEVWCLLVLHGDLPSASHEMSVYPIT